MNYFKTFRFVFAVSAASGLLAAGIHLVRQDDKLSFWAGYQALVLSLPVAAAAVMEAADRDGEDETS